MHSSEHHPLAFSELPPERMQHESEDFYARLRQRRSVQSFSDRPVDRMIIENAIRAAGTAPNGANLQPWHFAVVSDPAIKREIRLAAEEEERAFYDHRAPDEWLTALAPLGTDANKPFLETAPYLIAIFAKKTTTAGGGSQKNYYITESVGIATGMLITALHFSGLATLTHTPSPMGFLTKILGRSTNERPFLLLVVGYPAEHPGAGDHQATTNGHRQLPLTRTGDQPGGFGHQPTHEPVPGRFAWQPPKRQAGSPEIEFRQGWRMLSNRCSALVRRPPVCSANDMSREQKNLPSILT